MPTARHTYRSALLVFAIVLLSGCAGQTNAPTQVGTTSATLRATASCDTRCSYYFRYREAGTAPWRSMPVHSVGRVRPAVTISEQLSGLAPATPYEYQICGIGDTVRSYVCFGPTTTADTQRLTTAGPDALPSLDWAIGTMRNGALGSAEYSAAIAGGARISITAATAYAQYSAPFVQVSPDYVTHWQMPGTLAHELAHALVQQRGIMTSLNTMPRGLAPLGNELVAEMVASAVAKDGGWERGPSSFTSQTGALRTARQALDDILTNAFYLNYYKIDTATITEQDRVTSAAIVYANGAALITQLGGTTPPAFAP